MLELEPLKSISEEIWDTIKFIADILLTMFTFLMDIVKNIANKAIDFYFNAITTIFNNYPIPFILIIAVTFFIFFIMLKFYFKGVLSKKTIVPFLAILFLLDPLIITFVGYITKSSTSIDNNEKNFILRSNELKIKDKNISKKVNLPIDVSKIINHKIIEHNKVFEKKLQLEQTKQTIKIESLKQTIQLLSNSLIKIEKRLYAHDNDFSFYSKEIKIIKQNINNRTKDNNSSKI